MVTLEVPNRPARMEAAKGCMQVQKWRDRVWTGDRSYLWCRIPTPNGPMDFIHPATECPVESQERIVAFLEDVLGVVRDFQSGPTGRLPGRPACVREIAGGEDE